MLIAGAAAGSASAANRFTLDPVGLPTGNVAVDGTGAGYFAWMHFDDATDATSPEFCKVAPGASCTAPTVLPAPASLKSFDSRDRAFAVLGSDQTVSVVVPDPQAAETVIWTSTDGGAHFGTPVTGAYSGADDPIDAVLDGTSVDILGDRMPTNAAPDVAFNSIPVGGGGTGTVVLQDGQNGLADGTLGLSGAGAPVAVWGQYQNDGGATTQVYYSYAKAAPLNTQANWSTPTELDSNGDTVRLAGGPSGLFLLAHSGSGSAEYWEVRKWSGSGFGSPTSILPGFGFDAIGTAPNSVFAYDKAAGFAESSTGELVAAFERVRPGDLKYVVSVYASTDGVHWTGPADVATFDGLPSGDSPIRVAVAPNGQGYVLYPDDNGLQVADFTAIAPYVAPVSGTGTGPANPAPTPKPAPKPAPKPSPTAGASVTQTAKFSAGKGSKWLTITLAHPKCFLTTKSFTLRIGASFKGHHGTKIEKVRVLNGRTVIGRSTRGSVKLHKSAKLTIEVWLKLPHQRRLKELTLHQTLSVC